jgi:alanine racemase
MSRPIQAQIHTQALKHNLMLARQRAPRAKVWAVIKANAYGHGLKNVYAGLKQADGFALIDLHEAALLREMGWRGPILLMNGCFAPADLSVVEDLELTTVVHHEAQLRMLELHRPSKLDLAVYLKINSGMNRLGFMPADYPAAWHRLKALPWVQQITLMTQFACAHSAIGIAEQLKVFTQTTKDLPAQHSLANSATVLWHPEAHGDWIRPGIMLYGASPSGSAHDVKKIQLHAAMSLTSKLVATRSIQSGDTVGYGHEMTACRPMRIGIVACGYADGYPYYTHRGGAPVMVEQTLTHTLGRISMDMLSVDITDIPQAQVGSPVELWGAQLSIDRVAAACGTEGYELMCALAARVPKSVTA